MLKKMRSEHTRHYSRLPAYLTTARAVQRVAAAKTGEYICQNCLAQFKYYFGILECPCCSTSVADNLIPVYTEETPSNEMLSPLEFQAGD